ncbi:MAG: hypothetical protein AB7D57_07725 [Desulfovibrionaceae bacterium]
MMLSFVRMAPGRVVVLEITGDMPCTYPGRHRAVGFSGDVDVVRCPGCQRQCQVPACVEAGQEIETLAPGTPVRRSGGSRTGLLGLCGGPGK